jgi:hypothetical protein
MMMERVTISETLVMEPSFIRSCCLKTKSTLELTVETAYKLVSTELPVSKASRKERRDFFRNDCIMLFVKGITLLIINAIEQAQPLSP